MLKLINVTNNYRCERKKLKFIAYNLMLLKIDN